MKAAGLVRGLVCSLSGLAGWCLALGVAAQTAMFRGDAAHAGVYASAAPRHLPEVKWSFPTGERIVSSAAWADGTLYLGSADGRLYALE